MRLNFVVPGPTAGTRQAVFGDTGALLDSEPSVVVPRGLRFSGPEPACLATADARAAGTAEPVKPTVIDALRGPDFGAWQGLPLQQVLEKEPLELQQWLTDPSARPHGGESLVQHLHRVTRLLDAYDWPAQGATVVASGFTVRAACIHALDAGPQSLLHLDVAPGALVTITRNQSVWRLRSLAPPARTRS